MAGDGATAEAHLEQLYKSKKIKHEPIDDCPPCPEELRYLWSDFLELTKRRPYAGLGVPLAIPCQEIESYARLRFFDFEPWESELLMLLDTHVLDILVKQMNERRKDGSS